MTPVQAAAFGRLSPERILGYSHSELRHASSGKTARIEKIAGQHVQAFVEIRWFGDGAAIEQSPEP